MAVGGGGVVSMVGRRAVGVVAMVGRKAFGVVAMV
jgi:hypothetical protein